MAVENKDEKICSIHLCPPQACPTDCPNKHALIPDIKSLQKKERYFLKEEILLETQVIAEREGINPGDVQPEPGKDRHDTEGNLLYFPMRVTPQAARARGCGNIWYVYTAQGAHGPEIGGSEICHIERADSKIETPDSVDWVEVVLEYRETEGVWTKP